MLMIVIFGTLYYVIAVPESPKWLHSKGQFDKCRQSLLKVASYNAVEDENIIKNIKFEGENQEEEEKQEDGEGQPLLAREGEENEAEIKVNPAKEPSKYDESQYYFNLLKMSVFWTTSSFSFYLIQILTKNFQGGIFVNYYLDGTAGITSIFIIEPLYNRLKMKSTYLVSITSTLIFAVILLTF